MKERRETMLNYKKPAFWIIIAVVLCLIIVVCFMTNLFSNRSVSGRLAISMDTAVAEHYDTPKSADDFIATDFQVLGVVRSGDATTVYAWVLFEEYSYDGRELRIEQAAHIPTAITFDVSIDRDISIGDVSPDAAAYPVVEYWEPRDGDQYAGDIRAKFPLWLWSEAFDNSGVTEQQVRCREQAEAYFIGAGLSLPGKEPLPGEETLPADAYRSTVAWAGWSENSGIYPGALNAEELYIDSVRHLPLYKLDSTSMLSQFKATFGDTYNLDVGHDEVPSFNEMTTNYDDAFFAENTLLLVFVEAGSGSLRYGVRSVACSDDVCCVNVGQLNHPEAYTDDMAGWFLLVEMKQSSISNMKSFDAILR